MDYTFTGNAPSPGNHAWSTPQNWSPVGVPGAGDTATISGLVTTYVTLDQPITVAGLTLAGATVMVGGALTVTGPLELEAATLSGGALITANGSVSIDPLPNTPGVLTTLGCPLIINGSAVINSGAALTYSAPVAIQNNGTFTLADNANLDFGNNIAGQFVNNATLLSHNAVMQGGAPGALFTNAPSGKVSVLSGTLQILQAGPAVSNSGSFGATSNAILQIGSAAAFHDGAMFTGAGVTLLYGLSDTADGTVTVQGNLQLGGDPGAANLTELGTLVVQQGATLNWLGSAIQGNLSNIVGLISMNGTMFINAGNPLYLLGAVITNRGSIYWTNGNNLNLGYGAGIVNGGSFFIQSGAAIEPLSSGGPGYGTAFFQNNFSGILSVDVDSSQTFHIAVPFGNGVSGTTRLYSGSLVFEGGGGLGGTFEVGPGADAVRMEFRIGSYVGGSSTTFGTSSGSLILLSSTAVFDLGAGRLLVGGNGVFQQDGGLIKGAGLLEIASPATFLWTGGSIAVSDPGPQIPAFQIASNATVNILGPGSKAIRGGTCYNQGVINLTTNAIGQSSYVVVGDSEVFDNLGNFNLQCDEGLLNAATNTLPIFTNEASGNLVKSAFNGSSPIGFLVVNLGTVLVQSGILELAAFNDAANAIFAHLKLEGGAVQFDHSSAIEGTLQGSGKIIVDGTLTNLGNLTGELIQIQGDSSNEGRMDLGAGNDGFTPFKRSPSPSAATNATSGPIPGMITVNNFSQTTNGNLVVPILGANAANIEFGQLKASGSLNLGGTLTVVLTGGYAPPVGATFSFLSSSLGGSRVGTFDTVVLPPGIALSYNGNGATLTVTGATPVQILPPQLVSGQLQFGFNTIAGRGYTVQYEDDITSKEWSTYTNFTGNGSIWQFTIAPRVPRRFFRVSEP